MKRRKERSHGVMINGRRLTFGGRVVWDFQRNQMLYLMMLPIIVYYLIFKLGPMLGLSIAFMNYKPARGSFESSWIGLKHFRNLFTSYYFIRLLTSIIRIGIRSLLTSPAPIILALLLNELGNKRFSKRTQTVTYIPHFISTVAICDIIVKLTSSTGGITSILHALFGPPKETLLSQSKYFLPIYILSDLWQALGWNSIIYPSALTGIDQEFYDAVKVDRTGRFKQVLYITIPYLMPTIIIMLILKMGKIFNVGYERIMLLYNPGVYDMADVINTYIYRKGLIDAQYSYNAVIGLSNCVVSFALVTITDKLSKKANGSSLW